MRHDRGSHEGLRTSALWGKSSSGQTRSSALWGKGGRTFIAVLAASVLLVLPATGAANSSGSKDISAIVPADLLAAAKAHPSRKFNVIVQGRARDTSRGIANQINGNVKRKFKSIVGVSARMSGGAILGLARNPHVLAITADAPVAATSYENAEMWRESVHVDQLWSGLDPLTGLAGPAPQAPAIAIVDSGVDATRAADFGTRVVASVNVSSLSPGATGDAQGHGTMVAGIAAGASPSHPGVAQNAPIVSVRTADASGRSVTSDVIAAADWILGHAAQYDIRVANFSLSGSVETSFRFDPLDKAVERLWFSGIVVVAAAGNHGSGNGPVSMSYAPANDPFIITVGAVDQRQSSDPWDDTVAPWSGYGYTMDGFSKPDLVAPGRFLVMPVPMSASIPLTAPERVVAPGYMWMSGTSFAAPIVAGAAAQMLARHSDWGPNEVKGALMLTSAYLAGAPNGAAGVGEIDAATASSLDFTPPNPNENFYEFIHADPLTGQMVFDQASWAARVASDASWSSASWASASWASASWASASWASASWNSASWSSDVESSMTSSASWNE
jgi:serine protease AprX